MSPARPAARKLGTTVLIVTLCAGVAVFGFLSVALGFLGLRLGQIERLEVAEVLTAAEGRPVTAADVLSDGPSGDSASASGGSDGSEIDGSSGTADGEAVPAPGEPAGGSTVVDVGGEAVPGTGSGLIRALDGDEAQNFLIVGTDSIEGFGSDEPLTQGRGQGNRLADVIMVARIRPDATVAFMSVPRDLAVTIAGTGRPGKINSAYNRPADTTPAERAARMIDTIETALDIPLQHFIEVDLDGFRKVVDAIGGVTLHFNVALRDTNKDAAGNDVFGGSGFYTEPGEQLLDGDRALAYVRARHLQFRASDGQWKRYDGWSDLGRNNRQRSFLLAAAQQLAHEVAANGVRSALPLRVLDAAAAHVATSDTLNVVTDGIRLADRLAGIDFESDVEEYELELVNVQEPVPWSLGLVDNDANRTVLDVFRGVRVDDVVEWRVRVDVSGDGAAGVAAELREIDFDARVVPLGTSPGSVGSAGHVLRYGPQGRLAAALLLSHLEGATVQTVGSFALPPNTLQLVVGTDPLPVSADYVQVDLPPPVVATG